MTLNKLNYATKTNPKPIIDRSKQATAEDFNEIKEAFNPLVDAVIGLEEGSTRRSFATVADATAFWNVSSPKPDDDLMINIEDVNKTYKWASGESSKVLFVKDNIDGASVVAAQTTADNAQGTANNAIQNAALAQSKANTNEQELNDISVLIGDRAEIENFKGTISDSILSNNGLADESNLRSSINQELLVEGLDSFAHAKRVKEDGGVTSDLIPLDDLIRKYRSNTSLMITPHSVKAGKLYASLPVNGNGDGTVDRNCNATYIDKHGVMRTAGPNELRVEYDEKGDPYILVEPLSLNLLNQSEDFSNSIWFKDTGGLGSSPSVTVNQELAPDNNLTADRVVFNIGGGSSPSDISQIGQNVTTIASKAYTSSIWLKSNDGNSYDFSYLDITGAVSQIKVTNQWKRFVVTGIANGTTGKIRLRLRGGESTSDSADILMSKAQVEPLSYATSYIPTTTAIVTRLADSLTGFGSSSEFNSSEGVLFAELCSFEEQVSSEIALSLRNDDGGIGANRLLIRFLTDGRIGTVVRSSASTQATLNYSPVSPQNEFFKIAVKYQEDGFGLWVNGIEVATSNSGNTFSSNILNEVTFNQGNNSNYFYGKIKMLSTSKKVFTSQYLQSLTTP